MFSVSTELLLNHVEGRRRRIWLFIRKTALLFCLLYNVRDKSISHYWLCVNKKTLSKTHFLWSIREQWDNEYGVTFHWWRALKGSMCTQNNLLEKMKSIRTISSLHSFCLREFYGKLHRGNLCPSFSFEHLKPQWYGILSFIFFELSILDEGRVPRYESSKSCFDSLKYLFCRFCSYSVIQYGPEVTDKFIFSSNVK